MIYPIIRLVVTRFSDTLRVTNVFPRMRRLGHVDSVTVPRPHITMTPGFVTRPRKTARNPVNSFSVFLSCPHLTSIYWPISIVTDFSSFFFRYAIVQSQSLLVRRPSAPPFDTVRVAAAFLIQFVFYYKNSSAK